MTTLFLTIVVSLAQRFNTQQNSLVQSSRVATQLLDRTLESAESLLLSLADDLLQQSVPELERLQQRMESAVRFSDQFERILLIENNRVLIDSQLNALTDYPFELTSNHPRTEYSPGLHIGDTLPPLPGLDSQFPITLHLPDTLARQWTLLLVLNPETLHEIFEDFPVSMAGRYGLLTLDGKVLLERTPETTWPTQVQSLVSQDGDTQQLHTWLGMLPAQLSYYQRSDRYPLVIVRTLDYLCSLMSWARQNSWLLFMLLLSMSTTLIFRGRTHSASSLDTLRFAFERSHQPVLVINSQLVVLYLNQHAVQRWPELQQGSQLTLPNNNPRAPGKTTSSSGNLSFINSIDNNFVARVEAQGDSPLIVLLPQTDTEQTDIPGTTSDRLNRPAT